MAKLEVIYGSGWVGDAHPWDGNGHEEAHIICIDDSTQHERPPAGSVAVCGKQTCGWPWYFVKLTWTRCDGCIAYAVSQALQRIEL